MMTKYVTAALDLPSSITLISVIAGSEHPVGFVFKNEPHLVLTAYIDGNETEYKLVLSRDGAWHMRAVVEV